MERDEAVWDWLVTGLAKELCTVPAPGRDAIIERLARSAYASADTEYETDAASINARAELVSRLIVRLHKAEASVHANQPKPDAVRPAPKDEWADCSSCG